MFKPEVMAIGNQVPDQINTEEKIEEAIFDEAKQEIGEDEDALN